uniref:Endopeptidase Clp n=1 Tax=Rhizophora mucronata TaxID=61149 RepID=A0A2P2MSU0_RHIMU
MGDSKPLLLTVYLRIYLFFFRMTQGKRYSLPNSRIMIHQPLGGAQGGQSDIDIQVCHWELFLYYFNESMSWCLVPAFHFL